MTEQSYGSDKGERSKPSALGCEAHLKQRVIRRAEMDWCVHHNGQLKGTSPNNNTSLTIKERFGCSGDEMGRIERLKITASVGVSGLGFKTQN